MPARNPYSRAIRTPRARAVARAVHDDDDARETRAISNHAHKTYLVSHVRHAHDVVLVALSTRTTTAGASTHVEHTACALIVREPREFSVCGSAAPRRGRGRFILRPTDRAVRALLGSIAMGVVVVVVVRGVHGVRDDANTYATRRPRVARETNERRRNPAGT